MDLSTGGCYRIVAAGELKSCDDTQLTTKQRGKKKSSFEKHLFRENTLEEKFFWEMHLKAFLSKKNTCRVRNANQK